jgi:hypothetical protein
MKKILFLIILFSFLNCDLNNKKKEHNNLEFNDIEIIDPIEYKAEFKYGMDSIRKIIYSNMNLTKESGTVWISIKIDSLGNSEKIEIRKSENIKLNSEALRLGNLIPNEWKPAELGGKKRTKIPAIFYFPINFNKDIKEIYRE